MSGAVRIVPEMEDCVPPLTLEQALAVAEGRANLALAPGQRAAVAAGHDRLDRCVAEARLVYGVTTGFGPLANRILAPEHVGTLQRNLIYHLATGVGADLGWVEARLVVVARLCCLVHGMSGASPGVLDALLRLLASPLAPRIPEKGTVGASGDLTPLAHLALAMMGEGALIDRAGRTVPPERAEAALGGWHALSGRDGLALVNGTSAMTGISVRNAVRARRLIAWAELLSVGYAELLGGRLEAWATEFSDARPHPGQRETTVALHRLAAGSGRLALSPAAERRFDDAGAADGRPLQDAYTIRCVPQVVGAVREQSRFHDEIVTRELNSVTDNPIFPVGPVPALHGGNFMGQCVAAAADLLAIGIVTLAAMAERQIARVTDERLNGGLPAFLHSGDAGLNSGLMGAQVTATALVAEMRTRAVPASIQSISTNGANQDVVSMGTIASRVAALQIDDCAHVLAVLAIAVARGVDIRGEGFAPATLRLHARIRRISRPLDCDRPLSADIRAVARMLLETDPCGPDRQADLTVFGEE